VKAKIQDKEGIPLTNNDLSSLESRWKTDELWLATTLRRSLPSASVAVLLEPGERLDIRLGPTGGGARDVPVVHRVA
jgi:hypothetical protein